MATLYISEYARLATDAANNVLPITYEPPLAEQTRSISGTSAQSSAFNAGTRFIRVHTDAICSVLVGNDPTATTSNQRLPADRTEFYAVRGGDKIAVITNT